MSDRSSATYPALPRRQHPEPERSIARSSATTVMRHRTAPFALSSEHRPARRRCYPAGVSSGVITICARDVTLSQISFTG